MLVVVVVVAVLCRAVVVTVLHAMSGILKHELDKETHQDGGPEFYVVVRSGEAMGEQMRHQIDEARGKQECPAEDCCGFGDGGRHFFASRQKEPPDYYPSENQEIRDYYSAIHLV